MARAFRQRRIPALIAALAILVHSLAIALVLVRPADAAPPGFFGVICHAGASTDPAVPGDDAPRVPQCCALCGVGQAAATLPAGPSLAVPRWTFGQVSHPSPALLFPATRSRPAQPRAPPRA
jgi:hypothetical protein